MILAVHNMPYLNISIRDISVASTLINVFAIVNILGLNVQNHA